MGFPYWGDGLPLENIQAAVSITVNVDVIEIDITPLDVTVAFGHVFDTVNILIEALTMFPPGYGVSVSTENILITPLNVKSAISVNVTTIALEMLALAITTELVRKRKFPIHSTYRVLQSHSNIRKFPVIH